MELVKPSIKLITKKNDIYSGIKKLIEYRELNDKYDELMRDEKFVESTMNSNLSYNDIPVLGFKIISSLVFRDLLFSFIDVLGKWSITVRVKKYLSEYDYLVSKDEINKLKVDKSKLKFYFLEYEREKNKTDDPDTLRKYRSWWAIGKYTIYMTLSQYLSISSFLFLEFPEFYDIFFSKIDKQLFKNLKLDREKLAKSPLIGKFYKVPDKEKSENVNILLHSYLIRNRYSYVYGYLKYIKQRLSINDERVILPYDEFPIEVMYFDPNREESYIRNRICLYSSITYDDYFGKKFKNHSYEEVIKYLPCKIDNGLTTYCDIYWDIKLVHMINDRIRCPIFYNDRSMLDERIKKYGENNFRNKLLTYMFDNEILKDTKTNELVEGLKKND